MPNLIDIGPDTARNCFYELATFVNAGFRVTIRPDGNRVIVGVNWFTDDGQIGLSATSSRIDEAIEDLKTQVMERMAEDNG